MRYQINYTDEARRTLRTMPGNYRQRARRLIEALVDESRPAEAKELRDLPGRYRIRLDDWRIIYRINDEDEIITILGVRRKTGPETYEDIS